MAVQLDPERTGTQIRAASIVKESIVDGPGIRLVVFFQGCPHNCPGCHNPQTHPMDGGTRMSVGEVMDKARQNPLLRGITLSGGEPFAQAAAAAELAQAAKLEGLDVVTYTGYTFEQLMAWSLPDVDDMHSLLFATDILIDGPFLKEKRTLDVPFKGSSNQRIIDVPATIAADNGIVLLQV